ncbi:MAG TPA: amino acid ABC transporter permease [Bosea sp. (in: a-proteobacteria)]|jgi:polar amino acid transport system permease protein|uniref:amino acid ABC transporter permease n=1 Tax=Bosea sp. (in: a-proteobacteria) TaxID=1871050 RepID=UPI002DDCBA87|nr:amino acid ABC transporter permease [Bosea sp. (in: a-proteobacteria)]HEV2555090.1 amino acid ABC transporter permease [Bosea sp. (in: a-proteobacteria)]
MDLLIKNLPFILQGIGMTLSLALATLFFSTLIAFALGTLATLRFAWLLVAVKVYVELFRDIPLIVNIFFVFFVAPLFGLELSPFAAVTVGLSLWGSANGTEIVRAGFNAVPKHQWQSAAALGLKPYEVYLFVAGPQALRSILPPFVGLLTLLVQATSLGALVGVTEFFKVGQIIVERTTMMEGWNPAFTVYGAVLLIYFVICSTLSWFGRWLERRLKADRSRVALGTPVVDQPVTQLP